jgi:pantoate--beta-alanine ligase
MILITTVDELQSYLGRRHDKGETIGFVPTMGALHEGHMTLIDNARNLTSIVVASIFVNPTQFNENSDLKNYPRTLESDITLLDSRGCDVIFFPSVEEIYPPDLDTSVEMDLTGLDTAMEGKFRPGHFMGVAEVINRFLDIVKPQMIFMGQKDYQQVQLVELVVNHFDYPTQVVMVPTVRHEDGLARSSRNLRLAPEHRQKANVIFRTLSWAKEQVGNRPVNEVIEVAMANLSIPDFKPEYFDIVDGLTLQPVRSWQDHTSIVACTAVWAGEIRLIDNMILRS